MREPWRRHDLLQVHPEAWGQVLRESPHLREAPHLGEWAALGRPVMMRRRMAQDQPERVAVGLPLPPLNRKLRIALQVPPEAIRERVGPQALRSAHDAAPSSWKATIDALLAAAEKAGVVPCLFGSLLWQHLTGLPYLSATSDLDLLWPMSDPACAASLAGRIAAIEATSPVRLDGEFILPDGGGANWRELHGGAAGVLVKTLDRVEIRRAAELFRAKGLAA
jgi:phosphoribosyl-dephospho-CoA transferase